MIFDGLIINLLSIKIILTYLDINATQINFSMKSLDLMNNLLK